MGEFSFRVICFLIRCWSWQSWVIIRIPPSLSLLRKIWVQVFKSVERQKGFEWEGMGLIWYTEPENFSIMNKARIVINWILKKFSWSSFYQFFLIKKFNSKKKEILHYTKKCQSKNLWKRIKKKKSTNSLFEISTIMNDLSMNILKEIQAKYFFYKISRLFKEEKNCNYCWTNEVCF